MKKTGNQCSVFAILTVLTITLYAGISFAAVNHSIHIEWDYDQSSAPTGLELESYRLYKDGVQICEFDRPYDFEGDCVFVSDNGLYNFNLTAVFNDGSESPLSEAFPFLLGPKKANTGVILAVLGLLLNKSI
ncbi:MAG TPA: hypothetical protein EYG88_08280 [Desulfocapsa sulfexigens]|nr:hypothetical protein [Desulfocapsa sulfexigens]